MEIGRFAALFAELSRTGTDGVESVGTRLCVACVELLRDHSGGLVHLRSECPAIVQVGTEQTCGCADLRGEEPARHDARHHLAVALLFTSQRAGRVP